MFECIQQGKRLKSADHIKGKLPFVMAGIVETGIANYISNENVRKFPANSITIDILGNTFYRNYDFGASDDVGVFWNDEKKINPNAMLFICAVIAKSLKGRFDYGKKLRASQTYDFKILLPTYPSGEIAFDFIESFIQAVQKECIKNIVLWQKTQKQAYEKMVYDK